MQTETSKVNNVAQCITSSVTDFNNMLYAVALVVSERLGKGEVRQNERRKSHPGKEG